MGFGCVAKDADGYVMGVRAGYNQNGKSSLEAEVLAIFSAMQWAEDSSWECCSFLTDSAELFRLIQSGSFISNLAVEGARKCSTLLINNRNWRIFLIRRENNIKADYLAKKASSEAWSWNNPNAVPFFIQKKRVGPIWMSKMQKKYISLPCINKYQMIISISSLLLMKIIVTVEDNILLNVVKVCIRYLSFFLDGSFNFFLY